MDIYNVNRELSLFSYNSFLSLRTTQFEFAPRTDESELINFTSKDDLYDRKKVVTEGFEFLKKCTPHVASIPFWKQINDQVSSCQDKGCST